MFSNPMFVQALRFLARASLALALAFALLFSYCYFIGGRVPATISGVFLCMSCQALLPLAAFALWTLLPARRPASRSWLFATRGGRLDSRFGYAPELGPSRLSFLD